MRDQYLRSKGLSPRGLGLGCHCHRFSRTFSMDSIHLGTCPRLKTKAKPVNQSERLSFTVVVGYVDVAESLID